jgi:hypothetical protein
VKTVKKLLDYTYVYEKYAKNFHKKLQSFIEFIAKEVSVVWECFVNTI